MCPGCGPRKDKKDKKQKQKQKNPKRNLLWINNSFWIFFVLFCFCFFGPNPWYMEVSRPGVESAAGLQHGIQAESVTLRHSSWAMPDPRPTDRGQGLNLQLRIRFHCTMTETPQFLIFNGRVINTKLKNFCAFTYTL